MKVNMGKADRFFRFFVGILTVTLGFLNHSWLGVLGLIPLITALLNWCPIYLPFNISTCKEEEKEKRV